MGLGSHLDSEELFIYPLHYSDPFLCEVRRDYTQIFLWIRIPREFHYSQGKTPERHWSTTSEFTELILFVIC